MYSRCLKKVPERLEYCVVAKKDSLYLHVLRNSWVGRCEYREYLIYLCTSQPFMTKK